MKPDWQPSRRAMQQYQSDLLDTLLELFKHAPGDILNWLAAQSDNLNRWAQYTARHMVMTQAQSSARTWRTAAQQAMRGRELYPMLMGEMRSPVNARIQELIERNAELIRTLPHRVALQAVKMAKQEEQEGERTEALMPFLLRYVSQVQARRIARTEISKVNAALTQARSENLGIDWYVWRTSKDQRVRASHRRMENVLVRWTDPPAPERLIGIRSTAGNYNSGEIWNCRCYSEPLLRLDQVDWPHRVYYRGRLQYVTLAAFRRISNNREETYAA